MPSSVSKNSASFRAFSQHRSIRSPRVSSPTIFIKALNGERQPPVFRHNPFLSFEQKGKGSEFQIWPQIRIFFPVPLKVPPSTITPLMEFPPPFMYFDEECITISAPCFKGFIKIRSSCCAVNYKRYAVFLTRLRYTFKIHHIQLGIADKLGK